ELNSPYYNAQEKRFDIPYAAYASMQEQRVEIRTKVWQNAEIQAKRWGEEDEVSLKNSIKSQIQLMAYYQGCWSIWVTVFWKTFQDP
ncbi:hypothetical protein ABTM59_19155, partial [Acinetobacter baumannii]